MTALIFFFEPQQVILAMDTLAVGPKGEGPVKYTTKIFPVPHLHGVLCGAGDHTLIMGWHSYLHTHLLAYDLVHADVFVPEMIPKVVAEHSRAEGLRTVFYHFGYDYRQERFRGFAYRSYNNYQSEELIYGLGILPGPEEEFALTSFEVIAREGLPAGFIEVFKRLREIEDQKPLYHEDRDKQRISIGGELHCLQLEKCGFTLFTCHRFDDYFEMYEQMLEKL